MYYLLTYLFARTYLLLLYIAPYDASMHLLDEITLPCSVNVHHHSPHP